MPLRFNLDMDVAGVDRMIEMGLLTEQDAHDEAAVEAAAARALALALGIRYFEPP